MEQLKAKSIQKIELPHLTDLELAGGQSPEFNLDHPANAFGTEHRKIKVVAQQISEESEDSSKSIKMMRPTSRTSETRKLNQPTLLGEEILSSGMLSSQSLMGVHEGPSILRGERDSSGLKSVIDNQMRMSKTI